ncbi:CRISPR-associated endoribonuclease Cas6 [Clostridiales bacterium COT073_COT-073]|nr:CRISPR-associated endoribonuclease Cas6 [Clostridiales bacterium COT073_COT-073]
MLAKIKFQLLVEKEQVSLGMSSLFHGALMERISGEYADYLHLSALKPFTQYLELSDNAWYWNISTYTTAAYQEIIEKALDHLQVITLKHKKMDIGLKEVERKCIEKKEFFSFFTGENKSRLISLEFITPAAFKQRGEYFFFPEIFLIYQSLMNKYNIVSEQFESVDYETLEQLTEYTKMVHYQLRSTYFYLEGVKIPGFVGKITLKISGPQTMVNFANTLFEFGEFSGIGIKCSIGMGALKMIKGGKQSGKNSARIYHS